MKTMYDTMEFGQMKVKNRFVRSATSLSIANEDGSCSERFFQVYRQLAAHEVGLLISEYCYVDSMLKSKESMMGCYDLRFVKSYQPLADCVHSYGVCMLVQLVDCGSNRAWNTSAETIYGPSAVAHASMGVMPKEMTLQDIQWMKQRFAEAAALVQQAGFDGVQLHAAHGYLLSQFLTPYYNKRRDAYGGSLKNRSRFMLELIRDIRKRCGVDFHISVKLHCDDFMEEGFTFDECKQVCGWLERTGTDSIEISGGDYRGRKDECYYAGYAAMLAEHLHIPVIVVGGNRSYKKMDAILQTSRISAFSMCHALLCEPDIVMRWKTNPEYVSSCLLCGQCARTAKLCVLHAA